MKKVIFFLFILNLSSQSFSQHFNGTWVPLEFPGTEEYYRYMWFSDDNSTVFANDKTITAYSVSSGKKLYELQPTGHSLHAACISKDKTLWIQGNYVRNTKNDPKYGYMIPQFNTCDLKTKQFTTQATGTGFISRAIFGKKANTAYAHLQEGENESIVEFQIEPFKIIRTVTKNETNYIHGFVVNEEKNILAYGTGGDSKSLKIIDLETGELKKSLFEGSEIAQVRISSDGETLFASAYDNLFVLDLKSYRFKKYNVNIEGDGMYVMDMAIHPNNRSVAMVSKFGTQLLDTETGKITKIDKGQSMGCAFSKDGQYLVVSIRPFMAKNSPLRLFRDPQFKDVTYGSTDETVEDAEEIEVEEPKNEGFAYTSSKPAFSITFPLEASESRKQSKKDRLVLSIKCGSKEIAATMTVLELSSSFKKDRYQKLSEDVAENFIKKKEYEIVKKETIEVEGQKGIRYLLKLNNLYYDYRGFTLNGYNYQLVFIYDEKVKDLNPLNTYFNSFKLN